MTAGTFGLTESVIKNDSSERLVLEAGEAIEFTDPKLNIVRLLSEEAEKMPGDTSILISITRS